MPESDARGKGKVRRRTARKVIVLFKAVSLSIHCRLRDLRPDTFTILEILFFNKLKSNRLNGCLREITQFYFTEIAFFQIVWIPPKPFEKVVRMTQENFLCAFVDFEY